MERWVSFRQISSLSKTSFRSVSPSHLNRLLQISTISKSLKQAKQLHLHIILQGLNTDPYPTTKLIQLYADCDDLVSAHHLFDKLIQPNVFAWTAILAFYSRNGEPDNCLETYGKMRLQGVSPDGYVFPTVLKACAQSLSLNYGGQVHGDVIKFAAQSVLQVCNSLINMYSRCRDMCSARRVFEEMPERDLLSWNSMISAHVSNGLLDLAVESLISMRLEGFVPNLITWNTMMDAYGQMGLSEEACKIFHQIKEPNLISWTILILGYSRSGKHEKALCSFREMIHERLVLPDSDILACVLSSCRHLQALRNGQEIHGFGIKTQTGCGFHDSVGTALITMYSVCRRIREAQIVFEMMDKCDIGAWNAIISGFSHLGMGNSALNYFFDMQLRGVKYDQTTLSIILSVCDLKSGIQIHAHVQKNCSCLTILVQNALISMYSKCGFIRPARFIFAKMEERDVVTWNTMIGGYGVNGYGKAALSLLQEMRQSGVKPSPVTFTCALSACSHSGFVDEGLELFDTMARGFAFTPQMEHFACVVDLLGREGRTEDAFEFIRKMPIEPNGSIWGALLASCQVHQNIDIAEVAARNLFWLEPENPGNYVTLSNIYARGGRSLDAVRVRKMMECTELIKPSGYSWIETGS